MPDMARRPLSSAAHQVQPRPTGTHLASRWPKAGARATRLWPRGQRRVDLTNCLNIAGPPCTAQWEEHQVSAGDGQPFTLLTLPDAANSRRGANQLPPLYYCLPKTPQLARDEAGNPVFSLTLLF